MEKCNLFGVRGVVGVVEWETMGRQNLRPVDKIARNQWGKEDHMITTNGVENENL